jgi:hypothetical protein
MNVALYRAKRELSAVLPFFKQKAVPRLQAKTIELLLGKKGLIINGARSMHLPECSLLRSA